MSRDRQVDLLERSGLMDIAWYTARYWDVADTGMHPVWHYLRYGAALGRDPGPDFETGYYLRANADVAARGQNPLLHYLLQGRAEGRAPTAQAALDRQGAARVGWLRDCLWGQGLVDPALAALDALAGDGPTPMVRAVAAWEQAVWLLRQGDAAAALLRIIAARQGIDDIAARRRLATLEQMAFWALGDRPGALAAYDYADSRGHIGADATLARGNFATTPAGRLRGLNRIYEMLGLGQLMLGEDAGGAPFDRLAAAAPQVQHGVERAPKVSILIAAYKAEATLACALRSLQGQTWGNLEILLVDDASPDGTGAVAAEFAAADPRIRVISLSHNAGAYGARNVALAQAQGDYVTLMDADDWAHPARIETHIAHMQGHGDVIACTSQQLRLRNDLSAQRWTGRGDLITRNTASVFFRRAPVVEHLGGWDELRVSADSEMIRRMGHVFGAQAVVHLATGPLTLQRDHAASAVADPVLGVTGELYGARRVYRAAQLHHHARAETLRYAGRAPFAVPAILRGAEAASVHVLLLGDFRKDGVVLEVAMQQIARARAAGLRVGLAHWPVFDPDRQGNMHPDLRTQIDGQQLQELTFGETAQADLALLLDVECLAAVPRYLPHISAKQHAVVVRAQDGFVPENATSGFAKDAVLLAIGPDTREFLLQAGVENVRNGAWAENAGPVDAGQEEYIAALQQLGVAV